MDPYQPPDDRDSDNPYAPPQSAPCRGPSAAIAGMPFTVNDVFNWSWAIFKAKDGACLSIFWGVFGINLALSIVLELLLQAMAAGCAGPKCVQACFIFVVLFATIVIQAWLTHRHDAGHAQDRSRRAGGV